MLEKWDSLSNQCHGLDERGDAWPHTCFHHLQANSVKRKEWAHTFGTQRSFQTSKLLLDFILISTVEPLMGATLNLEKVKVFSHASLTICPSSLFGTHKFSSNPLTLQPHPVLHLEELQPTPTPPSYPNPNILCPTYSILSLPNS